MTPGASSSRARSAAKSIVSRVMSLPRSHRPVHERAEYADRSLDLWPSRVAAVEVDAVDECVVGADERARLVADAGAPCVFEKSERVDRCGQFTPANEAAPRAAEGYTLGERVRHGLAYVRVLIAERVAKPAQ